MKKSHRAAHEGISIVARAMDWAEPDTDEQVDEVLREAALDPNQVGRRISDRVESLLAVHRANDQAHDRNRALGELSDGLDNPLETILGYAEILLDGALGSLGDEQRAAVELILNNAQELQSQHDRCLSMLQPEAPGSERAA